MKALNRFLMLLLVAAWPVQGMAEAVQIRLGIAALRPKAEMQAAWQPIAEQLDKDMPGYHLVPVILSQSEMDLAVARHELDFVLTNPAHFIQLKQQKGLSAALATVVSEAKGRPLRAFGGTILARSDREDLRDLEDLTGKRLACGSAPESNFDGYQVQALELKQAGLPIPAPSQILITGPPQDSVVQAVLEGRVDAGFVRTGLIERMAQEGKLEMRRLKVLHRQDLADFPFASSTHLYPEWPLSALPHVDETLARTFTGALLGLEQGTPLLRKAGLYGFSIPENYECVENLMRELRVPPYNAPPDIRLRDLWHRYATWILALATATLAILLLAIRLIAANRRLTTAKTKAAQEADLARASEARFRVLFDGAADAVYIHDAQGQILDVNRMACESTGYTRKELLDLNVSSIEVGLTTEQRSRIWDSLISGRSVTVEGTNRRKDGSTFPVEAHIAPFGSAEHPTFYAATRDLSDRQRTESLLRESERKLAQAMTATADAVWEWDLKTGGTWYSPRWFELLGYPNESFPMDFEAWASLCHPEDFQPTMDLIQAELSDPAHDGYAAEFRMKHRDGHWVWVLGRGRVLSRDAEGRPLFMSGTNTDISARKVAEAEFRKTLNLLDTIVEHLPAMLFLKEAKELRFVRFNKAGETLLGFSRESLLGKNDYDFFPPDQAEAFTAKDHEVLGGLEVVDIPQESICTASGETRILHTRKVPLLDEAGKPEFLLGISEDITAQVQADREHRLLQLQLAQAQKMESLGSLAGGVAHDINNILAAILGLSSVHEQRAPEGTPLRRDMHTIVTACERGGKLVKGLLAFSRRGLAEERTLDVNELVKDEVALLERTTLQKVRLEVNLAQTPLWVKGDPAALSHALMNVCVNAVDAMPEGGVLTLRTRAQGQEVCLEIQDSGSGMAPEVLEKAMDPFFTTKPQGKGTGLGLSMVYATVKAHQGRTEILSRLQEGTTVRLWLPACEGPEIADSTIVETVTAPRLALSLLLVDDDELIQLAMGMVLESLGHTVTIVGSGEEALAWLEQGAKVDGIILDMNMPGLSGHQTLPLIRELRPTLPVLLATGKADQEALDLIHAFPGVSLLSKPFSREELKVALAPWLRP